MRIRDPLTESEEPYNLVPLTDMAFNLLIFFMAATTFVQIEKEIQLQLPRAGGFAALSAAPPQLVINIKQDGSTVVSGRTLDNAGLLQTVGDAMKADPNREVLIRADENSYMKFFAQVAAVCRRAGVVQTKIGYIEQPGG